MMDEAYLNASANRRAPISPDSAILTGALGTLELDQTSHPSGPFKHAS